MSQLHKYRTLLSQLRPLLPDYLRGHNVEINPKDEFRCINPAHEDRNPSCGFVDAAREAFKCFSCGVKGDIFTAAHLLEGRPLMGAAFLTENVLPLAKQFSIKHEDFEVSDQDLRNGDIYRAYELAGSILAHSDEPGPLQQAYGWSLEQVRAVEPYIGTVDWEVFTTRMRELGDYSVTYLEGIGLNGKLFNQHSLTFGIRTPGGNLCGFAARDTREKKSNRQQRWYNTSGDVPIFEKGRLLYGFHIARLEKGPCYLVEGYSDVLALRMAGVKRVVGYMGAAPTSGQIDRLRSSQVHDLVLVPDWDQNDAGGGSTETAIETILATKDDLTVRVKILPPHETATKQDPRDFVTTHGAEAFMRLPEIDIFDWRLSRLPADLSDEAKCEKMFPMVVSERRAIRQEKMLEKLAQATNVRLQALRRDLDRHLEEKRRNVKRKLEGARDSLRHKLDIVDVKDLPAEMRNVALQMEKIQDIKFSSDLHGPEETENFISNLEREFWDRGQDLPGWETGIKVIDEAFGGIPHRESWITIAADGNVGKSALVQNIAVGVAQRNEDVSVLLFTIDDTRTQTIPRLVAQLCGRPIQWVCQPQRYTHLITAQIDAEMKAAWTTVRDLIRSGKLDVKDASQGNTLAFAEQWIEGTRSAYPGRPVLFILDNFHRLGDAAGNKGDRERVEMLSTGVSLLAKQRGVSVISTMELRKREQPKIRPKMSDLKGTKQLEYDLTACIMVHSELHANPEKDDAQSWIDADDNDRRKPILQLWIEKNKITSFKGLTEVRFRPDTCQILPMEEIGPAAVGIIDDD